MCKKEDRHKEVFSPAITFTTSVIRSLPLSVTTKVAPGTAGFSGIGLSHQVFHADDFQQKPSLPGILRCDIRYVSRNATRRQQPLSLKQVTLLQLHDFEEGVLHFLQVSGRMIGDYLLFGGEMYHYARLIPPEAVKRTLGSPDIRRHFFTLEPVLRDETRLEVLIGMWTVTMQNPATREEMMRQRGYITPEEAEKKLSQLMDEAIYGPSLAALDRITVFGMVPEAALLTELKTLLLEHLPLLLNQFEPDAKAYLWRRLQSYSAVQEVWQEFCLKLWNKWNTYNGEGPLRSWFFRILQRCVLDYWGSEFRRNKRYVLMGMEPFLEEERTSEGDSSHSEVPEWKERELKQLRMALRQLKPRHQEIILLVAYREMPLLAAAEALGITDAAAKSRFHRAMRALKRELGKL